MLPSRDRKGAGALSNVAPSFQPPRQAIIVLTEPMVSLIGLVGLVRSVPRPHLRICALVFLALLSASSLHAQLSLSCMPGLGPAVTETPFSMTCSASGGSIFFPNTFAATGLPQGIAVTGITSNSITVGGTPTVSTSYDFTIEVDDFFFTSISSGRAEIRDARDRRSRWSAGSQSRFGNVFSRRRQCRLVGWDERFATRS